MKYLPLLSLIIYLGCPKLQAQYQYPSYSPAAKISQRVGHANVTIEYTRPIARGRKIFGGLIPYDQMWHTGASGTTIKFDRPVTVADRPVPAGIYAFQVFPRRDEWTFVLSTADDGIGNYNPAYDVVNVCVPVKKPGHFYDSYSVELDVTPGGATLYVSWTDVQIAVPITTPAEDEARAHIDSLAAASFNADAKEDYYRAASYHLLNQSNPEQLLQLTKFLAKADPDHYYSYEMMTTAYLRLGAKEAALKSLGKTREVLAAEFPGRSDLSDGGIERLEKLRVAIMAL